MFAIIEVLCYGCTDSGRMSRIAIHPKLIRARADVIDRVKYMMK